jgi:hypothetical protein
MPETGALGDFSAREILLAAAARTVLAALREPLEKRQIEGPAAATLLLLETALEPYRFEPPYFPIGEPS